MIREPPVGSSDSDSYHETHSAEKIKLLEEERDNLQKNMISLTSRMAQIEFRMSQVSSGHCKGVINLTLSRYGCQFFATPLQFNEF